MYDIVGDPQDFDSDKPPCLALEWMDCTLADVPSEHYRRNYVLLEAILNAGLSGFATLHEEKLVHTGRPSTLEGFVVINQVRLQTRKHSALRCRHRLPYRQNRRPRAQ